MEMTKPRLGRGLEALFNGAGDSNSKEHRISLLPISSIEENPFQPRKSFDDDELNSLMASIKVHGVLQPLVVRPYGDGYQLIAGERRLRASQAAGLTEVPVHVVHFNDQQVSEAALVENIQRSDLNAIEKAISFKDYLAKYTVSHETLGQRLGLDRSSITNLVNLLVLAPEVQDCIRIGQITMGHAKVLKALNHDEQCLLCREIIMKGLSVQALEQAIKSMRKVQTENAGPLQEKVVAVPEKTAHVSSMENELRQKLACRVEIKVQAKEKGQIVIAFDTNDEFERLMETLRR